VLFTQSAKDAPWKNVLEPYFLPRSGPGPFIETDHGYATVVSMADRGGLSIAPGKIADATASSLNEGTTVVTNPGNLADQQDETYFRSKLPGGSTDTDQHYVTGSIFALRTVGGGVLAFYHLTARLSLAPPPGDTFELGIPGFLSSSQALTSAAVEYVDQFATYIPPGQTSPQILADASGIVSAS
jgi:hypothetical protein